MALGKISPSETKIELVKYERLENNNNEEINDYCRADDLSSKHR